MRSVFTSTRPSLSWFHLTQIRPRPISSLSIPTRLTSSLPVPTRPTSSKPPQTPLFLRSPTHSATAAELRRFQNWAHTLSTSLGPDPPILLRELNWLLQDTFENPNLTLPILKDDTLVHLRTDIQNLYTLWEQRIHNRRPFQYIVGCEHWRDLVLSVEEGVLIPRPETELVVDLVDNLIRDNKGFFEEGVWADLGTGSGALAIGIARVLVGPGRVVATDLSHVALAVADYNVQRYNLQDKIQLRMGSWFEPLKEFKGELVGIVSNPPYIPTAHITGLQAEVGKHEPILALDGGPNGLDDLLHLCHGAVSMLKPGGFFVFETNGETQCKFLVDYLRKKFEGCFCDLNIVLDFADKQRFVTGYRSKQ